MDKQTLKVKIKNQAKSLVWRAITTVILTLTAVVTVWVYAAFVEPGVGPNSSDQDFAQNILGNNDANNDFTSTSVASNADGSIIERQEYIQTGIGTTTDASSMSTTLFAGQQYIADNLGVKTMYLTSATFTGNNNCDDVPANCCASGYHFCDVSEFLTSGRRLETSGTGRAAPGTGNGFVDLKDNGYGDCHDWTGGDYGTLGAIASTGITVVSGYSPNGTSYYGCNNWHSVWCCQD